MPIDALSVLCAQLTRGLLAIAKFLFYTKRHGNMIAGTSLTGALNARVVDRNRDSISWLYLASSRTVTLRPARCYQHGAAGPWQVVTLIAGSKRRSLLMAEDDEELFMTRSLNVIAMTTEQHLIARSDFICSLCS